MLSEEELKLISKTAVCEELRVDNLSQDWSYSINRGDTNTQVLWTGKDRDGRLRKVSVQVSEPNRKVVHCEEYRV